MHISTKIAGRFLLGGRDAGTSKFTGIIAIIGMAVGCIALIISISVLNGFEKKVTEKIRGFEGDIRIVSVTKQANDIVTWLEKEKRVSDSMPFMERKGILVGNNNTLRIVTLKAVETEKVNSFYNLGLEDIDFEFYNSPVIIGGILANRLGLNVGDPIKLMSPVDNSLSIGLPRKLQGTIAGIFQSNVLDYDDRLVFIPFSTGKLLFTRKSSLDGIDLRIRNETEIAFVKQKATEELNNIKIESWETIHESLFQAMKMERLGAIVVLSLIILVASFNLTSTLILVTIQKTREIGVLRTLGSPVKMIRSILLKQGFMVGSLGAGIGIGLSLSFILMQQKTAFLRLPEDIYFMDSLPMILSISDVLLVPIIAVVLIGISSLLASRWAVQIQPKDAVQMEK